MNRHHFISYPSADAQDFALRLCDELVQGPPTIQVWLDKRELVAGSDWDDQIVEAIRDCASVIFVGRGFGGRAERRSRGGCRGVKARWERSGYQQFS